MILWDSYSCFLLYTDFDEILQALPQFFKVLGHEMDWNFVDIAWINLVLSKVCVRFSNVLDASPHSENNVYIFLEVNANPTPTDYVIRYPRLFGQNFLASYWPRQQDLASHWLLEFENSTQRYLITDQSYAACRLPINFYHWAICFVMLTCLWLVC